MTQKRILILDEEALVLVVDKNVVGQVDERRGELTRSEFINFLIHSQLKEETRKRNYTEKEEFYRFVQEIKEILRNFLDFVLSCGLALEKQKQDESFAEWCQKIDALDTPATDDETP